MAKQVFHLHGVDARGQGVVPKRVNRSKLRETVAQLPPCFIGREACGRSQDWARWFQQLGHTVKLFSPQLGKPYVTGTKNDPHDAEVICVAVSRPQVRFVPLKTGESQDIQAIHRLRSRLSKEHPALVNQVRSLHRLLPRSEPEKRLP